MEQLLEKKVVDRMGEIQLPYESQDDFVLQLRQWPEWKIQSFCLDESDLKLVKALKLFTE